MRARRQRNRQLVKLRGEDAVTLDGEALELLANIALPDDLPEARKAGAAGVGLFRTEFLFLNREDLPSAGASGRQRLRGSQSRAGPSCTALLLRIPSALHYTAQGAHESRHCRQRQAPAPDGVKLLRCSRGSCVH